MQYLRKTFSVSMSHATTDKTADLDEVFARGKCQCGSPIYTKMSRCPPCDRRHAKGIRERNRDYMRKVRGERGCVDCGEKDPIVLDFDHIHDSKRYTISNMQKHSLAKVDKEIAKCVVRCANCHRRVTHQRREDA